MRKLIATATTTTLLFGASAGVTASPANAGGYTYGPKGSCKTAGGKSGYKEYFNGRSTGRCVLQ